MLIDDLQEDKPRLNRTRWSLGLRDLYLHEAVVEVKTNQARCVAMVPLNTLFHCCPHDGLRQRTGLVIESHLQLLRRHHLKQLGNEQPTQDQRTSCPASCHCQTASHHSLLAI